MHRTVPILAGIRKIGLAAFAALVFSLPATGQTLIARQDMKDFDIEAIPFPFESYALQGSSLYIPHPVMLQVADGAFVMVYINEKDKLRERRIERYNLLLELEWSQVFEIENNEEILELIKTDSSVVVISRRDGLAGETARVEVRKFNLDTGEPSPVFTLTSDSKVSDFIVSVSPDSSRIAVFSFHSNNELQRAKIFYDYLLTDDRLAYQVSWVEDVKFQLFDRELHPLESGTIRVRENGERFLSYAVRHCGVDNEGRIFVGVHRKKTDLQMYRWEKGKTADLIYTHFIKLHEFADVFNTHLPPLLHQGNAYWAMADREKKGWKKGTRAFEVIKFDFGQSMADVSLKAPITSSLLVQVEKSRETFGIKPLRNFDQFRIRGMFALGDTSIWLVTQYFEFRDSAPINYGEPYNRNVRGAGDQRVCEMILYEFDASNRARQAIIVPSLQYIRDPYSAGSRFTHFWLEPETGNLRLLAWEPSKPDLKGPERIHYKQVSLGGGTLTPRKIFYEGRRRTQYLLPPYICWLSGGHVAMMALDGDGGRPYLLTLRVEEGNADFDAELHNSKENWR